MASLCRWLSCLWAALLLSCWGATAAEQSNSSAPVGLRGYRRFFANDSLIGRPVPCTRDDKICFRHNLVYNEVQERCEPIGNDEYSCRVVVNKEEFEEKSGRLEGTCRLCKDPCAGVRMAFDGRCYAQAVVRDVICGPGATVAHHPLGEAMECLAASQTAVRVQQPAEEGACAVPDLRFPDARRAAFFHNPHAALQGFKNDERGDDFTTLRLQCGAQQAACFSQRKVFVQGHQGCHPLLERGPCAEEHVVALSLQAANQSRAEGTCVHVRGGCPAGHKRMSFDGQCHENREIQIEAPGEVVMNQFGSYIVTTIDSLKFIPKLNEDKCFISFFYIRVTILNSNLLDTCEGDGDDYSRVLSAAPPAEF